MSKRLGEKGDIAAFPLWRLYRGHFKALSNVARREMIGGFAAGGPSARTENCWRQK